MDLEQQKKAHIEHLRAKGFDITDLTVGSEKYISCPHIGAKSPKRIACYKTFINEKPGGGISLFTNYKTELKNGASLPPTIRRSSRRRRSRMYSAIRF